jgi:hypothetical protein
MQTKRFLLAVLVVAASARAENLELTLRTGKNDTARVTLGRDFIVFRSGKETSITDFARHLRFHALDGEPASVYSLYAVVGGSEREMTNRQFLSQMLDTGGAPNLMPLVLSESDLGMLADPPVAGIKREAKKDAVRFRWKKVEVGEYSTATLPATEEERKAFTRFLRYQYSGHPLLLADLEQAAGIPARIRLPEAFGEKERVLEVEKLERTPDGPYTAPANPAIGLASHETWGPLFARANAATPASMAEHVRTLTNAADDAFEAGLPLDAFLLYMEAYLTTGEMPPGLQEHGDEIMSDPTVALTRASIQPRSAEEARKALTTLEGLRKANPARAHVIEIFEANIDSNLGEVDEAAEHFKAVLTKEPRIAGVWHDLGFIFLNGYDAVSAWDAWDLARRIAPTHGMLKEIDKREQALVEKYPGFF